MILLLGLSVEHLEKARKAIVRALSGISVSGVARAAGGRIDAEYIVRSHQALDSFVKGRPQCLDTGLIVVAVTNDEAEQRAALSGFFPFAIVKTVDYGTIAIKHRPSTPQAANDTAVYLAKLAKNLYSKLSYMITELSARSTRTPIVLPVHHFGDREFLDLLHTISREFADSASPAELIRSLCSKFESAFPFQSRGGRSFTNRAGTRFAMPGRALHGEARNQGPPHDSRRYFAARLRLGAPIRQGFHFDCTNGAKRYQGDFCDCHGSIGHYRGNPHLNVYPNDFIR